MLYVILLWKRGVFVVPLHPDMNFAIDWVLKTNYLPVYYFCCAPRYGEIVNINLVRDKSTGKSKGFAFLCYEDQRSTVLAVDNLNSVKVT